MIHFSFSSVLMTILATSLMLLLIMACFRNGKIMVGIGYKLMLVFCIATLLRLLLPLELPFSKTLALPKAISYIVLAIQHPFGSFIGIDLSLWTALCVIWPVVAVVYWVKFSKELDVLMRFIALTGRNVTNEEPYTSILREICSKKQHMKIKVLKMVGIDSPMIFGLRKPKILLPTKIDVSSDDTLFAIKHEVYHYANHDLWVRTATKGLTLTYWWNPCYKQLNERINILQEMRIDSAIMDKGPEEAAKYLLSMKHHIAAMDHESKESDHSASMCSGEMDSLQQRFHMMAHHGKKKNYLMCVGMLLLIAGLYIGSYLIILEPSVYVPGVQENHFTTKDNIYAIENEDCSYDIYRTDGLFLETADTLEYYHWNIPVYSSEEENHEKNQ